MNDRELLANLEEELAELEAALPAHGLKPAHFARIEELEEQIEALKAKLAGADQPG